jgi:hypothetical protein
LLQLVVEVPGWQLWQGLARLTAFVAKIDPPMMQTSLQTPPEQSCELPQAVPSATLLQAVVELPGWQLWQALAVLTVLAVTIPPSM